MDVINAIAKVRFGSAKAQRVQLHHGDALAADLLCIEPGQQTTVESGPICYYVITGTATVGTGDNGTSVPTGQVAIAAKGERHVIANKGERRLVCLAFAVVAK